MSEVCVCPELPQGALVASEETGRADWQHPVPWAKLKTAQSSRQNDTCTHTKTYECSNSYAIQYVFHYWAPRSELSLVVYTDPQNAVKAFSQEKNALLGGGEERRGYRVGEKSWYIIILHYFEWIHKFLINTATTLHFLSNRIIKIYWHYYNG